MKIRECKEKKKAQEKGAKTPFDLHTKRKLSSNERTLLEESNVARLF